MKVGCAALGGVRRAVCFGGAAWAGAGKGGETMNRFLAGAVGLLLAGLSARAGETVLFAFDDVSIPWRSNLKLTMVQADKHPANPVLRRGPEGAPDEAHAILYGTVIKDGDTFRMWYLGAFTRKAGDRSPKNWRPMCYAESTDGVHWTKPHLGLVDFNGSRKNNICLIEGSPDSLTRVNDFLSVLHDPGDPDPARRFKVAYIAHVPYEEISGGMSAIGVKEKLVCSTVCATSADGLRWKVVGDRPANAGGERFEVSSLYRFGGFYYAAGQLIPPWTWRADGGDDRRYGGGNAGRVMLAYRSADFAAWSQAKVFAFARPGQLANPPVKGQQTHMGAGLWNRGNVLVGLYGMWQDAETPPPKGAPHLLGVRVDLGLVVSNDGIHFREPLPDFKVVARGKEGEWDDVALLQGHAFVNEGDRTMLWYSHWDTGGKGKPMEIGLATLRRDGFGYLSAQTNAAPAACETAFIDMRKGEKLYVNAEGVAPEAPLKVELLDERLRVFGAAQVSRSGLRVPALALPAGRAAVRVSLGAGSAAKLYALYVAD